MNITQKSSAYNSPLKSSNTSFANGRHSTSLGYTQANQLQSYGQQIINTVPLQDIQLGEDNPSQQQMQSTVYSDNKTRKIIKKVKNSQLQEGLDQEPEKPNFQIPTLPTKEYEFIKDMENQQKRLEEMKISDAQSTSSINNLAGENNELQRQQYQQQTSSINNLQNNGPMMQMHQKNLSSTQIQKKKMLVINTNHCRTEIDTVQYVIQKNGYKESNQAGEGNILWYGLALRDHDIDIIKIRKALVNRYPLMDHFAKKNVLCVILSRLQRFFPEHYNFIPVSFLLPDEAYELEEYMRMFQNQTFIAKPSKGRGGDGIFLVKKFSDLPRSALQNDFIVQRYIDNPYLINKKKFDLRIYLVIKGIRPLEAYLCDEGLARFCTSNYKKPDHINIKNLFMHLTNFSLNKNSEKFIAPEEEFYKDSMASKRLLTNIYKEMMKKGKDIRLLKRQIEDVSIKTLIAIEPYLANAYHCFVSQDPSVKKCFQILGIDILIDEQFNAWLMELNANPSLNVYVDKDLPNGDIEQTLSELDKYVKAMLISDTLKLVTTNEDEQEILQLGCLRKILPPESSFYSQFSLYTQAEQIFEKLAGQKGNDFITSGQFQRLGKLNKMTNSTLLKAHYDIIYKNVIKRCETPQMDLNSFFDALEEVGKKLLHKNSQLDNLREVLEIIQDQL